MSNQKEKAKELVEKFKSFVHCTSSWNEYDDYLELETAKQCAKIAVEEILEILRSFSSINKLDYDYWISVKQEINLL